VLWRVTAARELVERAHQVCPYSNATRGNIEVTPRLRTDPAEPPVPRDGE